jgi:hypothetical protein
VLGEIMKRVRAGYYHLGRYYTWRMEDNGWWTVGLGSNQIEDFRTYKEARLFILDQIKQEAQ